MMHQPQVVMETDEEERKVPALRIKLPSNATSGSPDGEEGEEEGMEGMEVNGGMEEENGVTEVPVEFDSNDDDDDEMMMPPVQVEVEMNKEEDDGDEDEQN